MNRRQLLQTGAGVTLSSVLAFEVQADTRVTVREVRDDAAAPVLRAGQLLVIDSESRAFAGNGLYAYPAWGQPRAYEVRQSGGQLLFSMPGQTHVLWQQPASAEFAGRVLAVTDHTGLKQAGLQAGALALPRLPA